MKTKTENKLDTVQFFRSIKEKLAKRMTGMTLEEQHEFLKRVREGKEKLFYTELGG